LIDELDILLCRGQLSLETKDIISKKIDDNIDNFSNYTSLNQVEDILYFIMGSPDYLILK